VKKILIIEDEHDIREMLKKRLSKAGYDALSASDGQGGLEICKAVRPDLLLLDIAMPGIDGYQICEKVKQDPETRSTEVIFLTGKDLDPKGVIEHCQNLGARGYLSKTSTFEDLLAKIKDAIG
jgi:CheY-like chemotaxis protein